jgi:hypothetical protein
VKEHPDLDELLTPGLVKYRTSLLEALRALPRVHVQTAFMCKTSEGGRAQA